MSVVRDVSFRGFPPEALEFYRGLEADNTKAYFDAHRETYERAVREPLEDLLAEGAAEFGAGKVFRPHRDVRFSKDKSPYKLSASAVAHRGAASYYLALSTAGLHVGGGVYELSRDQRNRYREAVVRPRTGKALERISSALAADGFTFTGPDLKRAPKGYDPGHERIALLRRTRCAATRAYPPGPDVHQPRRARAAVLGTWRAIGPLIAWLDKHVGPATEPATAVESAARARRGGA